MTKLSMQAFADSLGVSRITVWKVLNQRPGVSPQMRQKILDAAARQGLVEMPLSGEDAAGSRTISVAVSRPDSSLFWMQIIHHIAKELSKQNVNLLYTYLPTVMPPDYTLPASLMEASGIIVLNVYDLQLLKKINALSQPKVFLDTVPALSFGELTGDLILLEGRGITREITQRLLETGRTELGFLGDIHYAQTNLDRWHGFQDALAQNALAPNPRFSLTSPIGVHTYYEEISRFLDQLEQLPQAFVCASDFVAHQVQRHLTETHRETPPGFTLTGFDNNAEYSNIANRFTTVDVQTLVLGNRLARRILFLTDYPSASRELSYIVSDIVYRGDMKR